MGGNQRAQKPTVSAVNSEEFRCAAEASQIKFVSHSETPILFSLLFYLLSAFAFVSFDC